MFRFTIRDLIRLTALAAALAAWWSARLQCSPVLTEQVQALKWELKTVSVEEQDRSRQLRDCEYLLQIEAARAKRYEALAQELRQRPVVEPD
jgi:hypothetical protein